MIFYLGLAPVLVLLYWLVRQYWRWRIDRWCRERRLELLRFRFAWFWEQPYPLWDYETTFRIEVRDREGIVREGSLVFNAFWIPFGEPEVTWD